MNETGTTAALAVHRLATRVALLVWDSAAEDARGPFRVDIDGREAAPPIARLEFPIANGMRRNLVALRERAAEGPGPRIAIHDAEGRPIPEGFACQPRLRDCEFDAYALLDRATDLGKVRLARFLLEICRATFRLDTDAVYALAMHHLVEALCPETGRLTLCATVGPGFVLYGIDVPAALGSLQSAVTVASSGVRQAPFPPRSSSDSSPTNDVVPAWLLLPSRLAGTAFYIVVFGPEGLAVRRSVEHQSPSARAMDWLTGSAPHRAFARLYVLDCLARTDDKDAGAAALGREIAIFAEAKGRGRPQLPPVRLAVRACVATDAGLFVAGRLADPHRLVRALGVRGAGFDSVLDVERLTSTGGGSRDPADKDFACIFQASGRTPRTGSFQFELRLKSGEAVAMATVPAFATKAAARNAILRSLPAGTAPSLAVERVIQPALDALDWSRPERIRIVPEVVTFGSPPDSPLAALIAPFGRDRGVLLARASALCLHGRDLELELIHVLDRPAAWAEAERALAQLWTAFGLPSRLVVVPDCEDPTESVAAAVELIDSELVLFLGEGAVPDSPGWARNLVGCLAESPELGAVGGQVLNDDGSIKSAGYELVVEDRVALALRSPHAGFPRYFAGLDDARPVFAVSSAAMAVRREPFLALGGFSPGYATQAWRDAELCAGLAAEGYAIRYEASASVVDFQQDGEASGLGQDVASQCDAGRFSDRWLDRLGSLAAVADARPWHDRAGAEQGAPPRMGEAA